MQQSKYAAYNVRTHEGNWRQLTLRTNQSKEILAIIIFDKQDLTDVNLTFMLIWNLFLTFESIKGGYKPRKATFGRLL